MSYSKKPSFFSLPLELRNEIYNNLSDTVQLPKKVFDLPCLTSAEFTNCAPTATLLINKQFNTELCEELARRNSTTLTVSFNAADGTEDTWRPQPCGGVLTGREYTWIYGRLPVILAGVKCLKIAIEGYREDPWPYDVGCSIQAILKHIPSLSCVEFSLHTRSHSPEDLITTTRLQHYCDWIFPRNKEGKRGSRRVPEIKLKLSQSVEAPLYSVYYDPVRDFDFYQLSDFQRLLQYHPRNEVTYQVTVDADDFAVKDLQLVGGEVSKFEELEAEVAGGLEKVTEGEKSVREVYDELGLGGLWMGMEIE